MKPPKIVAFLFCLTSTIVYATDLITVNKPVFCSDPKTIIELISGEDFQEQPNWVGKDSKSRYILMVNEKTKTWSMIQMNNEIACIIGAGTDPARINLGKAGPKS